MVRCCERIGSWLAPLADGRAHVGPDGSVDARAVVAARVCSQHMCVVLVHVNKYFHCRWCMHGHSKTITATHKKNVMLVTYTCDGMCND